MQTTEVRKRHQDKDGLMRKASFPMPVNKEEPIPNEVEKVLARGLQNHFG